MQEVCSLFFSKTSNCQQVAKVFDDIVVIVKDSVLTVWVERQTQALFVKHASGCRDVK